MIINDLPLLHGPRSKKLHIPTVILFLELFLLYVYVHQISYDQLSHLINLITLGILIY